MLYARAQSLFRDLTLARADGSLRHLLARLGRVDVMVIDDWAMAPLTEAGAPRLLGDLRGTVSAALNDTDIAVPITRWHEQIGDPTLADGILDRLVYNAHRIEMKGDSMRKRGKAVAQKRAPGCFSAERGKGLRPFPRTPFLASASGLRFAPDTEYLDEAEHLLDNRKASVASLRSVFGIIPECRSASLRNSVHLQRNPQNCCLGRRMGLVRLDFTRVDPRFFVYQYISPPFRAFIDSQTIHGVTVERLALKDFPDFKVAVPPLRTEDRRSV